MKILIVSDTHGHERNLKKVIEKVGQTDLFIHLGDIEGHEDYIEALADCPVHMVSGNNDFFSDLPREEEFQLGRYRVLITHGHYYGVSVGTDRLKEEARSRNIDIVMYGHTHRPEIDIDDHVTVLNPGSLSYPRQWGRKPSYMLMEIDREGEAHYTINYIEN
ncbi:MULTISPECIES: metallophosphoesterase family protein [unclassified Blautia]|uniref:metallophosphoesterase family protein n=1 Tax=unclassified Blautia TaxID=2648079 RepID=UPI000B38FE5D|nr:MULTISPECIES: metallophosphoesterase [unclassified Blautia]OUN30563.1 YfcE family phosphodiesterase [Blautia sp. An81]OUN92525.1 YfcE family phosphodiesterase [Blautia sp. An46]